MTLAQQLHKSRFHRPDGAFDPNCPQCVKEHGLDGIIADLERCAAQNAQDGVYCGGPAILAACGEALAVANEQRRMIGILKLYRKIHAEVRPC